VSVVCQWPNSGYGVSLNASVRGQRDGWTPVIVSGFVTEGPSFVSRTALSFSIGYPPKSFRMPVFSARAPFDANEFLVVAVVPAVLPWMSQPVLACRRVAVGDTIYGASIVLPCAGLICSVVAVALAPVSVWPLPQTLAMALGGVVVGIICVRRVLAIRLAKKILRAWVAP
jgi:hypothetical protein